MQFAFSPSASWSRLANHRSRRFISRHQVLLIVLVLMAALLAAAIGGPTTQAATPTFAAKQDFATGASPRSVSGNDLNGDGKLDLAVVNLNSNTVSVLLNTTAPGATTTSFAAKQDFATGAGPVSVTVGDLNGDGKPDLAVANFNSNTVSVLLNTTAPGAATPSFADKQDVATSEGPIYVTTGDLNGDGKLDLAVVDLLSNTISVLLNTTAPGAATPSFAAKQDFATEDGPLSVAVGDLNGDGKLDLAVANFNSSTVTVLLNTTAPAAATCTFSGIQDFAVGDGPAFVSMGDMNGDGKLDLAIVNFIFNTVSMLLNTTATGAATASFSANQEFATGTGPIHVTLCDVNEDGKLDLIVANFNSNNVSVLLNSTAPGAATPSFAAKQDFDTGEAPLFIAVGDLNGDGKLDLAVANLHVSTVSVLLNTTNLGTATPGFAVKQDVDTGANPRSVTLGDLNGDSKLDLAVVNAGSNTVSVLLNTTAPGSATASFTAKRDFAAGTAPVSITVGDLNSDGKLDLVVANINSNNVSVLLNTTTPGAATPSFAAKQDFVTGDDPVSVTVGDLNGDGKLDLIVANLISTVSVLFNTTAPGASAATFATKQDFPTGDGPRFVSVGDLNGDGKLDLAVANFNSSTVSVLLNTTVPGAAAPSFAALHDFPTGVRPVSVSVGDLNGDGQLDLAVVNLVSNTVSVLLNNTAPGAAIPSFAAKQDFATDFNPASITVGDLNGDGKLDLTVANSHSDNVSVLLNTTAPGTDTPSFAAKQDFDTSDDPVSVTKGDLNGDGKLDLVVANVDSDTVSVLLNTPTIVTATGLSRQQGSAPSNSQIATVTNYGGNGSVSITVTSANPANGVTISNIINSDGNITADIVASSEASTATFTLQASDGSSTVTGTLNITVTANTSPTISANPVDATVCDNATATFTAAANGAPSPTVQWQISTDGGATFNNIAGATSTTLSFTANTTQNGNKFRAVFTNTSNTATTTAATLIVNGFALSGNQSFFPTVGGSGSVNVITSASCSWTAISNASFVHITGGGSGTGNGSVNYSVDPTSSPRTGTMTIAGNTFTVVQTNPSAAPATISGQVTSSDGAPLAGVVIRLTGQRAMTTITDGSGNYDFANIDTDNFYNVTPSLANYQFSPPARSFSLVGNKTDAVFTATADAVASANAIDTTEYFVRQQYLDFLNREPDQDGFEYWSEQINRCNGDAVCIRARRIDVSAAFFVEQEFQQTGSFIYDLYVGALGRRPAFAEYSNDQQQVIGGANLEAEQWAFVNSFVQRPEFVARYQADMNADSFVEALIQRVQQSSGVDLTSQRAGLISNYMSGTTTNESRALVLQELADDSTFKQVNYNSAFVLAEYFGYLRRDPDQAGYDFWLNILNNREPGNSRGMVCSFITSAEYQMRFSSVVTHSNADCGR